jgi:small subunit ribosomal protein S20
MKKSLRQSLKRRDRNRAWKVQVKLARRALLDNVATAGTEQNAERLSTAQKTLDKAAKRGILHRNTVARRMSKLAKRVNATTQ